MINNQMKYGFIKPAVDAHTMGLNTIIDLLDECGYKYLIANNIVSEAIENYRDKYERKKIVQWICCEKIQRIAITYRLDQDDAVNMVGYLLHELKDKRLLRYQGGFIEGIYFAGLPEACEKIEKESSGFVKTFIGGESIYETLVKLGVEESAIPLELTEGCQYDENLLRFGKKIIDSENYLMYTPIERNTYSEYGTKSDTVVQRIASNIAGSKIPLIRAHVGPYSASLTRKEAVAEFINWCERLSESNYLDILSIGTSQLSQSNFGENWGDKINGGGVPVNSIEEYEKIWEASRPMLVRTYSGTKNISQLAKIYEKTLNISWHALSLWWFNRLDGRGENGLYSNLIEHIETLKYIALTGKPFEANVSHHFSFRGADDVTYIVSVYLAAKLAKKLGIHTFILQNMLNTPRMTWGVQDLAKSRAMLKLIHELQNVDFSIILQPRAGLDYFKPDLKEAKAQLAAVTALMDDIEPYDETSPRIIHVVSYSEADHLATPEIINESIQITQYALKKYRELKRNNKVEDMGKNEEVKKRENELYNSAKKIILAIEKYIDDPYSADGFYLIFSSGFLPVPYLWNEVEEFKNAKNWKTKIYKGAAKLVDENGNFISAEEHIEIALKNLKSAKKKLNELKFKESLERQYGEK